MTRLVDLIVVAAYLGIIAFIGTRFSKRQTSTES